MNSAIVFIIFSYILIAVFSLVVFNNTFILLLNLLILTFFVVLGYYRFWKYYYRQQQIIQMSYFIEYIVLNYSVQKTIDATLLIVLPLLDKKLSARINKVKNVNGLETLSVLQTYFDHSYYDTFIELVSLIETKGGEILKAGEVLLATITQSRSQLQKLRQIDNRYFIKYVVHWIFIMFIVISFRYSLVSLSANLLTSSSYILGIEAFLFVMAISIFLVLENRYRRAKNVK